MICTKKCYTFKFSNAMVGVVLRKLFSRVKNPQFIRFVQVKFPQSRF
jgi:hypothetical protein